MIVVLGRPALGRPGPAGEPRLAGLPARIAAACAARGLPTQLAGSVGEDAEGDRVAVALGRAGVGHAALQRDPAARTPVEGTPATGPLPRLDAADVQLALAYQADCRVVVIGEPLGADAVAEAAAAAAWHEARLVALVDGGAPLPAALEQGAIVLAIPGADDPDADDGDEDEPAADAGAALADVVAALVAALLGGEDPAAALARATSRAGWERVPPG